ncbi:MAG: helix-turn-helix domain-containing protein [Elusimicrobia bacterium]|nr:helix-turn-helix domain-containing protein [Elusimicrobiota bacterium]
MDDIKTYVTVRHVAKTLGLTEAWIRGLIARKELKAVKIGQWKINPKDLEEFIKNRTNTKA